MELITITGEEQIIYAKDVTRRKYRGDCYGCQYDPTYDEQKNGVVCKAKKCNYTPKKYSKVKEL